MEIKTLFSLDIFLQGFFLLLTMNIGLYIVFKDNSKVELFWDKENQRYKNKLSDLLDTFKGIFTALFSILTKGNVVLSDSIKYIWLVPFIVILSFIFGALGKGVADDWIDSNNKSHLFLKSTWSKELHDDKRVKKELFKKVDRVSYKDLARLGKMSK